MADKDKQPTQADFDKAYENSKKDPKSAPKFIDGMPPKETPDPKKGAMEGALKGVGGKALGMKKGGSASARADGCAIRGKTRA
jgi:hypothetical protein